MTSASGNDLKPFHLLLFLFGGAFTGIGILNLYWSFGWPDGPLNTNHRLVGFSGLDNIAFLPPWADFSIPLVVVGIIMLIFANATAWKETDGY